MNIFENYLIKIKELVLTNANLLNIKDTNKFKGITAENPPSNFDYEISCNIALILAKINKTTPKDLASKIKKLLSEEIKDFSKIDIAGPGFLNIKLSNISLKKFVTEVIRTNKKYGANNKKKNTILNLFQLILLVLCMLVTVEGLYLVMFYPICLNLVAIQ
tara:strand:+ start:2246 stop:2728 length:483 start_codon:yes stop_codon:yes gene_type:complete